MSRQGNKGKKRAGVAIAGAAALAASAGMTESAAAADIWVSNTDDQNPGSLRNAIERANGTAAADRILFRSKVTGDIQVGDGGGLPPVTAPLEIKGPGPDRLTVDGEGKARILDAQAPVTISGLTFTRGRFVVPPPTCNRGCGYYGPWGGGALVLRGDATISDAAFVDNYATGGAAVLVYGRAGLQLTDSTFTGNKAGGGGGGAVLFSGDSIDVYANDSTISGSAFVDNTATGTPSYGSQGGAIGSLRSGNLLIEESNFEFNAARDGGAVSVHTGDDGRTTIRDSVFERNRAISDGGALSLGGSFEVDRTTVSGNVAGHSGGGLTLSPVQRNSTSVIRRSEVSLNQAGFDVTDPETFPGGGGLRIADSGQIGLPGQLRIENSTIAGNSAKGNGGGIDSNHQEVLLSSVTISANTVEPTAADVEANGAGVNQRTGLMMLNNSIVSGNTGPGATDLGSSEFVDGQRQGWFKGSFDLVGSANLFFYDRTGILNLEGIDPKLGPLADNGGPTRTMVPSAGSPVINKGRSVLGEDQRGFKRPVLYDGLPVPDVAGANGADIGAVEVQEGWFTFGKVRLNRSRGTATLPVVLPGAGELRILKSRSVKGARKKVTARGTVGLTVKARGPMARRLARKGSVRLKVKVRFQPVGNETAPKTKRTSVKLVRR